MDFRDYAVALTPSWLRQPKGAAFMRALGDSRDWMADRVRQSVLSRFFLHATRDALNYGGTERQLIRAPADTDAQFAERLRIAWDTWKWAGTPFGILSEMKASGYPDVSLVIALGKRYRLDTDGTLLTTDGDTGTFTFTTGFWNEFRVVFDALPAHWSGVVPSSTSEEANKVRGIIKRWKPGHAIFDGIVILNGQNVWGYGGLTWGQASLTWGSTATYWLPT
jgi:hypothetical protein